MITFNRLQGMEIIQSFNVFEYKQVISLSENVKVSDEFRYNYNRWLNVFFGKERQIIVSNGMFIMHPNIYIKKLMEHINKNEIL
jgi:hypothetical protein